MSSAETTHPAAGTRGILHHDHAGVMQSHAGEPYRPSNGTEGSYFESAWCSGCRRGGERAACQIHIMAMAYGVENPAYPHEWVYGSDGQPCCTAFSDKHAPRPAYRCKATLDLLQQPESSHAIKCQDDGAGGEGETAAVGINFDWRRSGTDLLVALVGEERVGAIRQLRSGRWIACVRVASAGEFWTSCEVLPTASAARSFVEKSVKEAGHGDNLPPAEGGRS